MLEYHFSWLPVLVYWVTQGLYYISAFTQDYQCSHLPRITQMFWPAMATSGCFCDSYYVWVLLPPFDCTAQEIFIVWKSGVIVVAKMAAGSPSSGTNHQSLKEKRLALWGSGASNLYKVWGGRWQGLFCKNWRYQSSFIDGWYFNEGPCCHLE